MGRPSIDHYSISSQWAQTLLGKAAGDEVFPETPMGTAQRFEVRSIKHKYAGFFQELLDTFPTRFPGARGFYVYTTQGGDVGPILEDIKRLSENTRKIVDLSIEGNFPLCFASQLTGKTVVEFAHTILSRGNTIKTCVGTGAERMVAEGRCREAAASGVVLDTYTAWVSHALGIFPLLKKLFGRVALPQSCLDELYRWKEQFEDHHGHTANIIFYQSKI